MSFLRHLEIYPSDGGASRKAGAPAHRLDEFPTGYSLAGWSPPEPASASPAGSQYAVQSSCWSRDFQRTANSVLTVCVSPGGKPNPNPRTFKGHGLTIGRIIVFATGLERTKEGRAALFEGLVQGLDNTKFCQRPIRGPGKVPRVLSHVRLHGPAKLGQVFRIHTHVEGAATLRHSHPTAGVGYARESAHAFILRDSPRDFGQTEYSRLPRPFQ